MKAAEESMKKNLLILIASLSVAAVALAGCGSAQNATTETIPVVAPSHIAKVSGRVHGGQQPVSGSAVYLFAAGSSGYGGPSVSLLNTALPDVFADTKGNGYVFTDSNGTFAMTGDYTCPSATAQVYAAAMGGNPGLGAGGSNPNLILMAALGPCGSLTSSTFIVINEVTTVASAWALAPFMVDAADVSTSPSNVSGLINAFAAANELVDTSTGNPAGPALPPGAQLPVAEMNTIANILATCVNSGGGNAGDNSPCGNLFSAVTPVSGAAPTDTLVAARSLAQNPVQNAASLFALSTSTGPFQPTLSATPTDWTIAIQYTTGGFDVPKSIAIDAQGNAWIANCGSSNCTTAGTGSITELSGLGTPVAGPYTAGGLNIPVSVAIDSTGNAWVANQGGNSITVLTSAGAPIGSPLTGGGLSVPSSISIDGFGNVWVANVGNSSISEFSGLGTALSPVGGYTNSSGSAPIAIATSPH